MYRKIQQQLPLGKLYEESDSASLCVAVWHFTHHITQVTLGIASRVFLG